MRVLVDWIDPDAPEGESRLKTTEIAWPMTSELPQTGDRIVMTNESIDVTLRISGRLWRVTGRGDRLETVELVLSCNGPET